MSPEVEIQELLSTYERALNTDDTALAVSCYAKDGVFMPTTLPTAAGRDLTEAYAQTFEAIHLDVEFTVDELVVASDTVAYALTRSAGEQTVHATGAAVRRVEPRDVRLHRRRRPPLEDRPLHLQQAELRVRAGGRPASPWTTRARQPENDAVSFRP